MISCQSVSGIDQWWFQAKERKCSQVHRFFWSYLCASVIYDIFLGPIVSTRLSIGPRAGAVHMSTLKAWSYYYQKLSSGWRHDIPSLLQPRCFCLRTKSPFAGGHIVCRKRQIHKLGWDFLTLSLPCCVTFVNFSKQPRFPHMWNKEASFVSRISVFRWIKNQ